jgi:hypothetical protein
MSGRDRRHYVRELRSAEQAHQSLLVRVEAAYRVAHQLLCEEWNTRQFIGGPVDPSPTIAQATHGGCILLEVRCKRCGHESEVNLKEIIWPRSNQVHTLVKVLRCQPCSDEGKRSRPDLIALRLPTPPGQPARPAAKRRDASR